MTAVAPATDGRRPNDQPLVFALATHRAGCRTEIAGNTIVVYTTDNGAMKKQWPDGGASPFRSEKDTNWEGAYSDDGDLVAYRDDHFKYIFAAQYAKGMEVWRMPLRHVRAPIMIDLRSDPYEYAVDSSAGYEDWAIKHAFLILPAVAKVGSYLQSYKEFPPRQRPASFSIDQVKKLEASTKQY